MLISIPTGYGNESIINTKYISRINKDVKWAGAKSDVRVEIYLHGDPDYYTLKGDNAISFLWRLSNGHSWEESFKKQDDLI
jgi:hypothetical protein